MRIISSLLYFTTFLFIGLFCKIFFRFRVKNKGVLPKGGGIICCNHTSLWDPVLVAFALGLRDKPRFMAKKELFENRLFAWIITIAGAYPVNRQSADLTAIKKSIEFLKNGKKLLIFPEGTRIKEGESAEARNGAGMIAARTGAPLIPAYLSPGRRPLFDRVCIVFGEPVCFPEGVKITPEIYKKAVDDVMSSIGEMREAVLCR